MLGDGHVRKSGAVERAEEEVAGAVAGKEATGAVGSVGGWGETEDDHPGPRVPEPRDGATPVLLAGVGGLFLAGDLLAPLDETRAVPAGSYLVFQLRERVETLPLSFRFFDISYAP